MSDEDETAMSERTAMSDETATGEEETTLTQQHASIRDQELDQRLASISWDTLRRQIDNDGYGIVPRLLDAGTCAELRQAYREPSLFRSRIVMERYRYGRGEYQYFDYPLPQLIRQLREHIYPQLVPLANDWAEKLNWPSSYPQDHAMFRRQCHAAGQLRPTPLLLRYQAGDYNCLHQDIYGDLHFPLQMIVALSQPGEDYQGGELILVEQRPRQQSRPRAISLPRGDAIVIAVRERPEPGKRGYRKLQLRHGVSTLHAGERFTLGLIFHDAK